MSLPTRLMRALEKRTSDPRMQRILLGLLLMPPRCWSSVSATEKPSIRPLRPPGTPISGDRDGRSRTIGHPGDPPIDRAGGE
ncbi:MAG: hypothetical protein JW797_14415 [Bradymonadales bacterium]|nr:hypothetical protein [Bradymonadales bacterium]